MTKQQKITLSASRDIPFNKLMLSQSNVRHVKSGVSIEELAEDIARRTLLSSITVRPVLDDNGAETGMYTIPAGGRRFRALELLVKQKRMNKTALVPCIVRTDGLAEEDSLAENVQRAPLHPLDQFRAFQAMREKGRTEEEIAAAFFVSASVVKQRLKLAAVAPSLHDAYAEEEMTLDQLMAFTVNPDHARQEQVWEALQRHYLRQMYDRFGSPGFLAAYNAGPARYQQHLDTGRALPLETRNYLAILAPLIADGTDFARAVSRPQRTQDWRDAPLFAATADEIQTPGDDAQRIASDASQNGIFVPLSRGQTP